MKLHTGYFRRKSKSEIIRNRMREKGFTEAEIDDIESAEGDRKFHAKQDMELEDLTEGE